MYVRTSEETPDVPWTDKDHLLHLMTAPASRTGFQDYLDYDGRPIVMDYVTPFVFTTKSATKL